VIVVGHRGGLGGDKVQPARRWGSGHRLFDPTGRPVTLRTDLVKRASEGLVASIILLLRHPLSCRAGNMMPLPVVAADTAGIRGGNAQFVKLSDDLL
jgi:hypothetical protein